MGLERMMRHRTTSDEDRSMEDEEMEDHTPVMGPLRLAYIKVIGLDQARAMGLVVPSEIHFPANAKLYALHAADGRALGITDTWDSAYSAAVQNDFLPLSVH
jgi:hypothetical protein